MRRRPGICFSPGFFSRSAEQCAEQSKQNNQLPPFFGAKLFNQIICLCPPSAPVGAPAGPNCLGIQLAREVFNFFSPFFSGVTTLLSEKFSPSLNTPHPPPSKVKSLPFLGFGGGRGGDEKRGVGASQIGTSLASPTPCLGTKNGGDQHDFFLVFFCISGPALLGLINIDWPQFWPVFCADSSWPKKFLGNDDPTERVQFARLIEFCRRDFSLSCVLYVHVRASVS